MTPAATLLVTAAEDLVDEVSSLASASGVAVAVAPSAAAARAQWCGAPLVLLGEDAVEDPVPSRRAGVLVLTSEGPGGEELWRAAVAAGAEQVLCLPDDRTELLRRLGGVAEAAGGGGGPCVAVMGTRGGVGGSTLAAALAWRCARSLGRGAASLLVDTDLLGGGADLLLGAEEAPGLRWGDLARARGSVRGQVLAQSLPRRGALAVLSGGGPTPEEPLRGDVVEAVLRAARPHHAAVVVDAARRDDEVTGAALAASDLLLLLVAPDVGSVLAGRRVLEAVAPRVADVRLVLRTGSRGSAGGTGGLPVAAVVDALGAPLAATLAHDRGLAATLARGEPPGSARRGALARACEALEHLVTPPVAGP